jgi:rhamnogalacturonan acetylesterase
MSKNRIVVCALFLIGSAFILGCAHLAGRGGKTSSKPTLFIIGDSTVKNGKGDGEGGLWGWGEPIVSRFDTLKIRVRNHAIGGRSSRTFQTEGRWNRVLSELKSGDFVVMQFGHNDGGSLNTGRARGTLKGTGEETEEVVLETTGKKEVVHTYGWYMKKYVADTKAAGGVPIVLSPVPRNMWADSTVNRASGDYGKWAKESAEAGGAFFIDLNEMIAKKYEAEGPKKVQEKYFTTKDHTHTTLAGAELNADCVVEGIRSLEKCRLVKYILPSYK